MAQARHACDPDLLAGLATVADHCVDANGVLSKECQLLGQGALSSAYAAAVAIKLSYSPSHGAANSGANINAMQVDRPMDPHQVFMVHKGKFIKHLQLLSENGNNGSRTVRDLLVTPFYHGQLPDGRWLTLEPMLQGYKTVNDVVLALAGDVQQLDMLHDNIVEALKALAQAGINHCDAHCGNIMVRPGKVQMGRVQEWDVKFIDYDWVTFEQSGQLVSPMWPVNHISSPPAARTLAENIIKFAISHFQTGRVSPDLDVAMFQEYWMQTLQLAEKQHGIHLQFPAAGGARKPARSKVAPPKKKPVQATSKKSAGAAPTQDRIARARRG